MAKVQPESTHDRTGPRQPAQLSEPQAEQNPPPGAGVQHAGRGDRVHRDLRRRLFRQAYLLDDEQNFWLLIHAAFIPIRYCGQSSGRFLSFAGPVTYSLLHGSIAHLAVNMIWLAAFGSPLANRIGALRFVLFWVVTSIAAAGLHYVLLHDRPVAADRRVGRDFRHDGGGRPLRLPHRPLVRRPAFGGPVLPMSTVLTCAGRVAFLAVWMVDQPRYRAGRASCPARRARSPGRRI